MTVPATPADSLAFQPLQVGRLTLSARMALAAMTRLRVNPDHSISELAAEYYSQRASYPGILLISEGTIVSPEAGGSRFPLPGLWNAQHVVGWKRVVDAVHAQGSYLYLQLAACGRAATPAGLAAEGPNLDVVGPSAIAFEGGAVPREMTEAEIRQYAVWFAKAAKAFVDEAGGDGVELHGANGFLLDQFLQTNSNHRTDSYGGSLENRARFSLQVLDAVCTTIGADRTAIRLSPFSESQGMKMAPKDIDETFTYLVREIKTHHPDLSYLHLVEPRVAGTDDLEPKEGEDLTFLAKEWAPKALLVAGGVTASNFQGTLSKYENAVAVFGRWFISNPDLVARVKHGVALTPYDRSTFYVPGADSKEGYTTYKVEYGPEGKL